MPWYERAQRLCGLGPFRYGYRDWVTDDRALPDSLADGDTLIASIYQFGSAARIESELTASILASDAAALETGATALRINIDDTHAHSLDYAVAGERETRTMRARTIVLAAGALENARLLLLSDMAGIAGPALGRGLMEHPRDYSMRLVPANASACTALRFFDQHAGIGGTTVMGRLGLQETALREAGLTQVSVSLFPRLPPATAAVQLVRNTLRRVGLAPRGGQPLDGPGWSDAGIDPRRFRFVQLLLNLEQPPHAENRLRLDDSTDRYGQRRLHMHWRWRAADQSRLERLRSTLQDALHGTALGRVVVDPGITVDPNAHHHAGTTRMSLHPSDGVVDPNGRMHGVDNVFIAGASVFPSAGFANPTLTIIALGLRLGAFLTNDDTN